MPIRRPSEYAPMKGPLGKYLGHFREPRWLDEGHNRKRHRVYQLRPEAKIILDATKLDMIDDNGRAFCWASRSPGHPFCEWQDA